MAKSRSRIVSVLLLLCLARAFVLPVSKSRRRTHHLLREKLTVQDLLSEKIVDDVVAEVTARLDLPYVPDTVINFLLTQIMGNIGSEISEDSMDRLQEALQAAETQTAFDNIPLAEVNSLASQIAAEINPSIDIPVLNEEQELEILREIMKVVLVMLTTTEEDRRSSIWSNVQESRNYMQDLLTPKGRNELVDALNDAVDVPILNEEQEEALLHAAVESVAALMTRLLPPSFLDVLKGESPEGLQATKDFIINEVNSNVDLIGLNESQERDIIKLLVDIMVDTYVDQSSVGVLLLSSDEQNEYWQSRRRALDTDINLSQRRYRREQFNLSMQRNRLEMRLAKTTKKSKGPE